MSTFHLVTDLEFTCDTPGAGIDDAFDTFTDRIMDALGDLEEVDGGIIDADISASITNRELAVLMTLEADSLRDAVRLYLANVRTALHAAGCGTPDCPTFDLSTELPEPREVAFA